MVGERRAPKRSTRKDVALRARTSTAVVSYVINRGPRPVAPATRDRVHAAIAELDYRPNGIARTLRAPPIARSWVGRPRRFKPILRSTGACRRGRCLL